MIKTVRINKCSYNYPKLLKSSFVRKIPIILIISLILLATSVTGANAIANGNLDIFVINEKGGYQSGAKVELYNSTWVYIENKTTGKSGIVLWTDMKIGTYRYKVYYGSEFWGGGDAVVKTGVTTTKKFQRNTPYVVNVAISDNNGIAKTTFAPGEKVHVNVTVKNPALVYHETKDDTKSTLRIDQEQAPPYTFEETHGPNYTSAGGYAYYEWDWKISIASGTYYINPLVLTNISNNYILTDDAGWGWNFTKTAPPKGYGAWMDNGINSSYVQAIKKYNYCPSSYDKSIKYLFPYTGTVNETLFLKYNSTITEFYKNELGLYVYPTIGGDSDLLTDSTKIENLAKDISAKLNDDMNADGLHLDIEPYNDTLITLVNEIRNRTNKPISVAIGQNKFPLDLFRSADFVVLMNYGLGGGQYSTPIESYTISAKARSRKFLINATVSKGYGMIGVPAVATKNEWNYTINTSFNPPEKTPSGITMEQYLNAALNAKDMALINSSVNESNYVGISIWAIKDHPGEKPNNLFVYPYNISYAAWGILKGPIIDNIKAPICFHDWEHIEALS